MLLNIQELKLHGFRNRVLRLEAGKYKTIFRLCRLTAVVSQIRCNNGCMNRWKSGYSKFVSLKPLSQQNSFLSLKVQASSEIIWFEMLYRTDHRTLRRLSLCTFRFGIHEIEPSLCTILLFRTIRYGMKRSTSCKFVVLLHPTTAHLASIFFEQHFQPFPQKQVNVRISESSCSRSDVTSGPRPISR